MGKRRKITKEVNLDRILTAYKYNHLAVIKNSFDLLNGSSEIISTLTLLYRGLYNNGFDNNIPEEFKNISHDFFEISCQSNILINKNYLE